MSNTTNNEKRVVASFIALDSYVQKSIPTPTETKTGTFVRWGSNNKYPDYLLGLYNRSATLRSVIDGCVDYIVGDDVLFRKEAGYIINPEGETASDLVRLLANDLKMTGGFAIEVCRNDDGDVVALRHLPIRFLRSNKDNTVFWYSEKWGGSSTPEVMPAFMASIKESWPTMDDTERKKAISSVFYYKADHAQTYPSPCYRASIPSCEIEANIDDFHLNSLENGFTASAVLAFHNGIPSDEQKAEIERNAQEKFTGHQNAARIFLSFADDKDHGVEVQTISAEDFGERYQALEKSARQKRFTSFRAVPAIFGINPENNGFSATEYAEAFKLFNRTQIKPSQQMIIDAFAKIYGEDVLEIVPFTLGDEDTSATLAADRGVGGTQALMAVIESEVLSLDQKRGTLKVVFGLTAEQAGEMLGAQPATI